MHGNSFVDFCIFVVIDLSSYDTALVGFLLALVHTHKKTFPGQRYIQKDAARKHYHASSQVVIKLYLRAARCTVTNFSFCGQQSRSKVSDVTAVGVTRGGN